MPPLLALAHGCKVRPRRVRVPVPKEISLHVHVANLLNDHMLPTWEFTHINRTAKDARQGKIFKTMGVNPNWPDFLLIAPDNTARCLELKRAGKDLSDGQKEFRARCIKRGTPYVFAWTIDQVLIAFDDWGCVRTELPSSLKRSDANGRPYPSGN